MEETKLVVNENMEGALIKNDSSIFEGKNGQRFTSMNLEEKTNKVMLYNSLQQCDVLLNDIKGTEIEINNIYVEKKEIAETDEKTGEVVYDEKTGEVVTKTHFRTILFGIDGTTYVSSAYGIYNSLRQIVSVFGIPSEENPLKVKVGERTTRNGRKSLILTVVE